MLYYNHFHFRKVDRKKIQKLGNTIGMWPAEKIFGYCGPFTVLSSAPLCYSNFTRIIAF